MPNPEDITDPTTAMNMVLVLMAKAFKLNYSTPTNNNQRISSNPRNRQIAQPSMNLGQDNQMQMNVGNQNGLIVVPRIANQNGNGNVVVARAEGNANGNNGNQIRCYNYGGLVHLARNCTVKPRRRDATYLQTQLLIAQKEEAGIQLQDEEFDLMAAAADLDEIEEVYANCILMANFQQASTSGTQSAKLPSMTPTDQLRKSSQSLDLVQDLPQRKNSKIQETSQYSESRTPIKRGDLRGRLKSRCPRSMSRSPERTSVFSRIQRDRSASPRHRQRDKRRREGDVFHGLGGRGRSVSTHSKSRYQDSRLRRTEPLSESKDSGGGDWKSKSRKQKSSVEEEDLSQPWTCEEANPFTPRIRYFELPKKSRMPNNVKTYDGSDDPEDHLKIFQASTKKSIDSYDDLKKAFLANYLQQNKCIKDPVEIHHIKQGEGESTEDFVQRFKAESRHVKGAPECMRVSGFMHGITNPEFIKRLYYNIPKLVDEMMRITTTFLRGEVAASNQARNKALPAWKQQDVERK
ncbi:reverse transcriptase domain-containing protein [Tanacetum coccineum]